MKHNKWMKFTALAVIAVMSVMLLASCQSGATYVDETGDESLVSVIEKDQQVEVPYTGEPIKNIILTSDPAYADQSSGNNDEGDDETDDPADVGDNDTGDDDGNEPSAGDDDNEGGDVDWAGDTSGTAVTIMSQNIRFGNSLTDSGDGDKNTVAIRRYRFKALVDKYSPDVICTQEVTPLWIEQFENILTDYDMVYKMRSDSSKEATPVHWKKSKYDLEDSGHFWLSETPEMESNSYGESYTPARITSWVKLKDKATGSSFYVYSTHFGLGGGEVAIGAGNQLANELKNKPSGTYAFFLGDLNTAYMSEEYHTFVDWIRTVDLRDIATEMADAGICEMGEMRSGTMNHFQHENGNGNYIDHVIAKPNAKMAVEFYGVLYDQLGDEANNAPVGYISDHFAVLCKVRIDTKISYADFYGNLN